MAIGGPNAPGDFGRRIDGNSRIIRRKRPRPHPVGARARIAGTLPAEYAEFRLEDGRTFGEVMGAGFFGLPSGADGGEPISDIERQRIREGNYPLARMVRENPDRFAPPRGELKTQATSPPPGQEEAGLPAPGGDNEAEFTNLPFGPEEGDAPDSAADFPIAKPPQGIGAALSGPDGNVPDADPQAVTGIGGAGLSGLDVGRIDIEELAAQEPQTYDDYMSNAKKIARAAGISDFEVQRFATGLARLRGKESAIANAPTGVDRSASPRQVSALEAARREAANFYDSFVEKALARRDTPLDFPRTVGTEIDMDLVQRGFVYKSKDGVLFMIDPGRTNFVQVRRRQAPGSDGALFEVIPKGESVSIRDMMFRANGRGPYVTHRIPMTGDGGVKVANPKNGVIYEVEDGRFFQLDDVGKNFREMRRLSTPDEQGRGFAPIPDQQSPSLTADLRARQGGYGPPIIPQPLKLTDKHGNIRRPSEIQTDARALAEQAGRGRLLAIQIGTKAIEAADFQRRLDDARFTASELGIDPNDYPDISGLQKAYRREMRNLQALRDELLEEIKPELVSIEEMANRLDDPARLENAANNAIQGGGEVLASIPIFIAINQTSVNRTINEYWNKVDVGTHPLEFTEFGPKPNMNELFNIITRLRTH